MVPAPNLEEMAFSATAELAAEKVRPADPSVDWRAFHDATFDLVWRLLVRFGAPAAEVEDLVQDVYAVVHRKLPSFRREASVSTWLFAICRKVAASARRRARARAVLLDLLGLAPRSSAPVDPAVAGDLQRVLSRLSETKRVTLLLHEVDGMSPSEIATLFGCSEATVWSRLRLTWKDLDRFRIAESGGDR